MKKNKLFSRRMICIVSILLTMFSSYFLAKYISSSDGSSDASVAKWSVEYVSNIDALNLVSGNTAGNYILNVTSVSEVSANYSIVISNAPNGMEVKVDDGTYQTIGTSGTVTFNNMGSFSVNDVNTTHTHTVTFNAPLESNMPSTNSIDIDVVFVQND